MAPRKKKQEVTPTNGAAKPNGAMKPTGERPFGMSDDEVNAYLASIAKGEVQLVGMESDVAEKFRAVTHQSQQIAQAVQQLAAQLEQARAQQQQLAGELKGYATLLISAEDSRRSAGARKTSKQRVEEATQADAQA